MKPHFRLEVWKRSMDFVTRIYRLTGQFPNSEKFGLVSQMQRVAVSIPANIAEGAARSSKNEFKQFLSIAQGSTAELETLLIIAKNLGYAKNNDAGSLLNELDGISKMIIGLRKETK